MKYQMKIHFINSNNTLDLDPKDFGLLKTHMEITPNLPFIVNDFEYMDYSTNNIHLLMMYDEDKIINFYNFYDYLMAKYSFMRIIVQAIKHLCVNKNIDVIKENYPELFYDLTYTAEHNFERFLMLCENDQNNIKKYIISSLSIGKLDIIKKYWGNNPEKIDQEVIDSAIKSGNIETIKYFLDIDILKDKINDHLKDQYTEIIKHNNLDLFNFFHESVTKMLGQKFIDLYNISYHSGSSNLYDTAIDIMKTFDLRLTLSSIGFMGIDTISGDALSFHLNCCIRHGFDIREITFNTFFHCADIIFRLIYLEKIKMWLARCLPHWDVILECNFDLKRGHDLLKKLVLECEEYIQRGLPSTQMSWYQSFLIKDKSTKFSCGECGRNIYLSNKMLNNADNYSTTILIINQIVKFAINTLDYEFLDKFKYTKLAKFVDAHLLISGITDNNYECLYDKLIDSLKNTIIVYPDENYLKYTGEKNLLVDETILKFDDILSDISE